MLDKRILERLFRQNYSGMIRLARTILGDDGEAEDVVQDVFVRVMENSTTEPAPAYLYASVKYGCINVIRQKRVHEQVKELLPVEVEIDLQPVDRQTDKLDQIAAFVDEWIKEPHRTIFHMRFDDDLTVSEIAKRMEMNPNTTYKYLMQCIGQIRHFFNNADVKL